MNASPDMPGESTRDRPPRRIRDRASIEKYSIAACPRPLLVVPYNNTDVHLYPIAAD